MKKIWKQKNGLICALLIGLVLGAGILPNVIAKEKRSTDQRLDVKEESTPLWLDVNKGSRDQLLDVLVVKDTDSLFLYYYESALNALGYSHQTIDWANPYYHQMTGQYLIENVKSVIWFTYNETSETLDADARTLLGQYLDLGGKLFVSGCNIAEDLHNQGLDGWLQTYLGAEFKIGNEGDGQDYVDLSGTGIFSTVGTIRHWNPSGGIYPDGIKFTDNPYSMSGFTYKPPAVGWMGAVYYYQVVFFAFAFEAISEPVPPYDQDYIQTVVMSKILKYLIPGAIIDPNYSSVTLTNENRPGLNTCPAGDELYNIYQYVKVTCRNAGGNPISGIPARAFTFILGNIDAVWYGTLSCTFTSINPKTDANGEIKFTVKGDTSIYGNITIQVGVRGVPINDIDTLSCKSYDYNTDGSVSLADFTFFGQDFGSHRWRSDFNWDGDVSLADLTVFGPHFGHHHNQ